MSRFLKNFSFYVIIPSLVIGILFEILLRNIPTSYAYKKHYLDNNADSIQTLVLGASTAYFNINPAYLSGKSFNAANREQTLDIDYEILKKYDGRWKNLKWIIVPIHYASLFFSLEHSNIEPGRLCYYIIYFDLPVPHKITNNSVLLSFNFHASVERLISHYIYRNDFASTMPICSESGWGTEDNFSNRENMETSAQFFIKYLTFKAPRTYECLSSLKSIINYAKERNINVFMYIEPAFHTFTDNLDQDQLKETIDTVSALKNNNSNVVYADFMKDPSYTERDFYDATHLDEFGAKKLTLKIDSIITGFKK